MYNRLFARRAQARILRSALVALAAFTVLLGIGAPRALSSAHSLTAVYASVQSAGAFAPHPFDICSSAQVGC